MAPATVTAAEATSTVYVTSTKYDLCLCPPTLIYTTTVTRAGFAAAAPTATVAAGGICKLSRMAAPDKHDLIIIVQVPTTALVLKVSAVSHPPTAHLVYATT